MSAFSFSFSGDDIEDTIDEAVEPQAPVRNLAAETGTLRRASSSAFPISGQPLLVAQSHDMESMLKVLPSSIAYSTLVIKLDDGSEVGIPRRELWDVKVQMKMEGDDEGLGNLRKDDVRTGVYEGGFKSWESSVDIVKVLSARRADVLNYPAKVLEVCQSLEGGKLYADRPSLVVELLFLRWHYFNGYYKANPLVVPGTMLVLILAWLTTI